MALQVADPGDELVGPVFWEATPRTRAVMRRYHDAYKVANTIVRFGKAGKAVVGMAIAYSLIDLTSVSQIGWSVLFDRLPRTLFIGAAFWLGGVLVTALGQLLIASLDGAVNTSPFLGDDQKAKAMSLPGSAAEIDSPNMAQPDGCATTG